MGRKFDASGNEIQVQPPLPQDGPWIEGPMPIKMGISGTGADEVKPKRKFDATGNEIGGTIPYNQIEKDTGPKLESNGLGHTFIKALPTILGTMGGIAGAPTGPGAIAGAAGGYGLGSLISNFPNLLKSDTSKAAATNILEDTAIGAGTEAATPLISKGLSRGRDLLTDKLIRSFSIHGHPEDVASMGASGIPFTVGQATQSPILKFAERSLAGEGKSAAVGSEQKAYLDDWVNKFRVKFQGNSITPEAPEELFGTQAKDAIERNYAASRRNVDEAYKKVKFDAKANTVDIPVETSPASTWTDPNGISHAVPAQTKNVSIEGPIIYSETAQFMQKIKPQIDKLYERLPDGAPERGQLDRLKKMMDSLQQGLTDATGNKSYIADWDTIKELRTQINDVMGNRVFGDLSRGEGGLTKLSERLGKDIETSISNLWENKSPGALNRLKTANALHAEQSDIFNRRVKISAFGTRDNPADPSQIFRTAFNTPEASSEMIRALGPNDRRIAKSYFFEDLMKKAADKPDQALNLLEDASYKKVFSSSDKADLTDFFRTMRRVQPDNNNAGNISLALRKTGIAIGLGAGAYDYFSGDSRLRTPALVGATALIGSKSFAEKVLLNPRFARSAARLAKLAPDADEATFLRKSILTALRGTALTIRLASGDEQSGKIDSNGKFQLSAKD